MYFLHWMIFSVAFCFFIFVLSFLIVVFFSRSFCISILIFVMALLSVDLCILLKKNEIFVLTYILYGLIACFVLITFVNGLILLFVPFYSFL